MRQKQRLPLALGLTSRIPLQQRQRIELQCTAVDVLQRVAGNTHGNAEKTAVKDTDGLAWCLNLA